MSLPVEKKDDFLTMNPFQDDLLTNPFMEENDHDADSGEWEGMIIRESVTRLVLSWGVLRCRCPWKKKDDFAIAMTKMVKMRLWIEPLIRLRRT